jgi:hypothetical protein
LLAFHLNVEGTVGEHNQHAYSAFATRSTFPG